MPELKLLSYYNFKKQSNQQQCFQKIHYTESKHFCENIFRDMTY